MLREGIVDKISLLAKLSHPYVVAPRGVVEDSRGQPIGWFMDYAAGEPIARAFTNDWRQQYRFGDREASVAAARMAEVVRYAHDHGAVMADANELNWVLVTGGKNGVEPRCLDVDSWAIGRWPARAIMPSIRDWHTPKITDMTDWFAWGVVSFQLYTGIHPYKGTLAGYRPGELERRMRDNASVFAPGVRLNRAVRDFSCIPGPLLDWYEATFQAGTRTEPPSPQAAAKVKRQIHAPRVTLVAKGALQFESLYKGGDEPVRIFECGIVLLSSGKLFDLASGRIVGTAPLGAEIVRVEGGWLVAALENGKVVATLISTNLTTEPVTSQIAATGLLQAAGRLFATGFGLTELTLMRFSRPVLAAGQTWGALASTVWFSGVGLQNTLGSVHLILPYGDNACAHLRVPELDGRRVITARAGHRFVSLVVLDKDGVYRKLELSIDRDYRSYSTWTADTDTPELNLAILPRGVAATVVRDGELVIFVPSNGDTKRVADSRATTTIKLANWNNTVIATDGGTVWKISLQA
jgi:hypothetical protein